jgi:hypothetical protein
MSGLEGGDDGELSDDAVAALYEVAKQAKYLVPAELRASLEEYVALLGRLQMNNFEMTSATPDGPEGTHRPTGIGVYPSAARINHSCAPNCHHSSDAHGCLVVDTVRDIRKGEEVTIPYVDLRLPREKRRAKLRELGFDCNCARCHDDSLPLD